MKDEKNINIELIRIIASFLVICNHTDLDRLVLDNGILSCFVSFLFGYIIYCNTNLFFMISGYLLHNRQDSIQYVIKHRVSKIVCILAIFNMIYYFSCYKSIPNSVEDFSELFNLFFVHPLYTYWFLYAYLGLLLLLPFMNRIINSIKTTELYYLILLNVLFTCIIPTVLIITNSSSLTQNFQLPLVTLDSFFFYIIGGSVKKLSLQEDKKFIKFTGIAAAITLLLYGTLSYFYKCTFPKETSIFITLFIFCGVNSISLKKINTKVISYLGGCTLCIYLIEEYLRHLLFIKAPIDSVISNSYLSTLLWVFIIYCIGIIVASVMKKLPILNKLL